MWCPSVLEVNGKELKFPLPEAATPLNFTNSTGLRYEAEEVRQCLLKGTTYSELNSHWKWEAMSSEVVSFSWSPLFFSRTEGESRNAMGSLQLDRRDHRWGQKTTGGDIWPGQHLVRRKQKEQKNENSIYCFCWILEFKNNFVSWRPLWIMAVNQNP